MYTSIAVISVLTTVAVAQTPTSAANPLMPSGVTSVCSTYLTGFNAGTSLSSCTNAITGATKDFAPGSNASSTAVSSALQKLCGDDVTSACQSSAVRAELTKFWTACQTDISNKNQDVVRIYDTLFALIPFRNAVCSTDDNGAYCANSLSKNSKSIPTNLKDNIAYTPGVKRETAIAPNTTTIGANNLLFLFLSPSTSSAALCTTCTRKVFAAYTNFETDMQYGPGLDNSPTLYGQSPLYDAINTQCGPNFLAPALQAAGSLSGGSGSSGDSSNTDDSAAITTVADIKTVIAVALGIVTALASFN